MHAPKAVLVAIKREAMGDEHPDFSGEGFPEARIAAMPDHPDPEEGDDHPEPTDVSSEDALRIASELRELSERSCALAAELADLSGQPGADDEGSHGEAREL